MASMVSSHESIANLSPTPFKMTPIPPIALQAFSHLLMVRATSSDS